MREMKYSGVEWMEDIPASWNMIRFKDKYQSIKEIAGESSSEYERLALTLGGVIKRPKDDSEGLQPKAFDGYQILRENDFVFKMIDLQNVSTSRVGLSPYTGLVSPAYIRFCSKNKNQFNKFVYYYLMSMYYNCVFNSLGGDGVRSALNASDMGMLMIPFPSEHEQMLIVEAIESQTDKVDALIANQEAQIVKLKAYKQSLITEIVTKGLDPNVKMKDSGVEWIGKIPDTWEINRGKFVLQLLSRPVKETDEVITCFRDGEVTLRKNRREDGFTFSDKEIGYQGIEPGDLVIHGMDGFAGAIGISDSRGKASPVLIVCDSKHNKKYMSYYLRNLAYRDIFVALSTGIRVRSCDLRWNKLANLPFVLPSLEEQNNIVLFLDEKIKQIDELIDIKRRKIDRLTQYKKSLIYECVTGKREVN